eukprot:5155949-Amphidinium_carterae.1
MTLHNLEVGEAWYWIVLPMEGAISAPRQMKLAIELLFWIAWVLQGAGLACQKCNPREVLMQLRI